MSETAESILLVIQNDAEWINVINDIFKVNTPVTTLRRIVTKHMDFGPLPSEQATPDTMLEVLDRMETYIREIGIPVLSEQRLQLAIRKLNLGAPFTARKSATTWRTAARREINVPSWEQRVKTTLMNAVDKAALFSLFNTPMTQESAIDIFRRYLKKFHHDDGTDKQIIILLNMLRTHYEITHYNNPEPTPLAALRVQYVQQAISASASPPEDIVRELYRRLMVGAHMHPLRKLWSTNPSTQQLGILLKYIHSQIGPITIDDDKLRILFNKLTAASDACIFTPPEPSPVAMFREHFVQRNLNINPKQEKPKMSSSNKAQFKTITYYNDIDVTQMSNEDLIEAVYQVDARVKHLEGLEKRSKHVAATIESLKKSSDQLVAILDSRNVDNHSG